MRDMRGTQPGELLLEMKQVDKWYPGVHALDQVDFDLRPGEVHVLLGENGAGKSTLVKILSGSVPRDSGSIVIQDKKADRLTPERAQALGIGMVYQELSLIPALTVAENIFLGRPPRRWLGVVDWPTIFRRAQSILAQLGVNIDPRQQVRRLDVAEQQLTEIARVLAKEPRILLLDEPTSALSETERERLFEIIRRLQKRGVGIVYISHRLSEVPLIGQRVTVLRDGRVMGTLPVEQADEHTLVQMMVGRTLTEQFPDRGVDIGETLLRVEGLSLDGTLHRVSLELRRAEILGVFGLMGAGQRELSRALFGLESRAGGRIYMQGREVRIQSPLDAIREGLGLLTRDRREGLVPMLPVPPNLTLAEVSQSPLRAFLRPRSETATAATYVEELNIQPPFLNRAVAQFSGGNQQKVLLARWLYSKARILIFDEPTRGIDVGAKAEVYALMNHLTERGVGILMISSEMPELLAIADRILVMRRGRFVAEFSRGEATQQELLRSAS